MGFVSMRKNFGHHMRTLLWVILAIFVVGCFYWFGSPRTGPAGSSERRAGQEVLAVVNGEKIRRAQYDALFDPTYEQYEQMGVISLGGLEMLRSQVMGELVRERLLVAAAKREGVKVSSREVEAEISRQVEAALKSRRATDRETRRMIEASIRSQTDSIHDQLLIRKLEQVIASRVKATDEDVRNSYREVRARHILIRVDATGKNGLPDAAARREADQLLAKLNLGADFATLAKQKSQDRASAARGGDLGFFRRGDMTPAFEQAAFALKPGRISPVVRTPYGYHIIKLEQERSALPADFEKNKEKYRKQYLQQAQARASQDYLARLFDQAMIELRDPEIQAAKALSEGRSDQAIAGFEQALANGAADSSQEGDQIRAAICYTLGDLQTRKGDYKAAAQMYERSLDLATSSLDEIDLALGRTYEKLKQRDKAREYYQAAEDMNPDSARVHSELLAAYTAMGDKQAAARQQKWLDAEKREQAEEQQRRMADMARAQAEAAKRKAAAAGTTASPRPQPGETSAPQPPAPSAPKPPNTSQPRTGGN